MADTDEPYFWINWYIKQEDWGRAFSTVQSEIRRVNGGSDITEYSDPKRIERVEELWRLRDLIRDKLPKGYDAIKAEASNPSVGHISYTITPADPNDDLTGS